MRSEIGVQKSRPLHQPRTCKGRTIALPFCFTVINHHTINLTEGWKSIIFSFKCNCKTMMNDLALHNGQMALCLLHQQRFDEASKMLKDSLKSLLINAREGGIPNLNQASFAGAPSTAEPLHLRELSIGTIEVEVGDSAHAFSPHNAFCLFHRAIELSTNPTDGRPTSTDHAPFHMLVMMYNFAISLHCEAVTTGDSLYLHKAMRIYEACIVQLRRFPRTHERLFLILQLAVVNNLGHIHSHMFCAPRARECLQYMSALLSTFNSQMASPEEAQDAAFFYNQCLFHRSTVLQSAAAA